jgi:very-short-patch-repair endonuclease
MFNTALTSLLIQEGSPGLADRVVMPLSNIFFIHLISIPLPMSQIHNRKQLEPYRKSLRSNLTSAEAALWNHLKQSQLGIKFRRQHSVGPFILDFYCATRRVAIELDGASHFTEQGIKYDEQRTEYLNRLNIKVIRFENARMFEDLEKVLEEIKAGVEEWGK